MKCEIFYYIIICANCATKTNPYTYFLFYAGLNFYSKIANEIYCCKFHINHSTNSLHFHYRSLSREEDLLNYLIFL